MNHDTVSSRHLWKQANINNKTYLLFDMLRLTGWDEQSQIFDEWFWQFTLMSKLRNHKETNVIPPQGSEFLSPLQNLVAVLGKSRHKLRDLVRQNFPEVINKCKLTNTVLYNYAVCIFYCFCYMQNGTLRFWLRFISFHQELS